MLNFSIPYFQYLTPQSTLSSLPDRIKSQQQLVNAYQDMLLARTLDKKCIALQRTGQMGTYPSALGHEGVGIALGHAMAKDDVFVPYYRDMPTQLMRGVTMTEILLYWGGDERGSDFAVPKQDFPNCVPIATQALHATGVATAMKIRHQKRAVLTTIGDGGSSKADFLEALNVAGAWQLPVVFVIVNNQWAISVPRQIQCGAKALAQKGIGAGLPSIQVDGNDYLAVYQHTCEALERARQGKGATLIEAITYRLSDHTTADDATRYRDPEEVNAAWQNEPVKRLQQYLFQQGLWDEQKERDCLARCQQQVETAVAEYLATPPMPATAMLDKLWATLPRTLEEQFTELAHKTNVGGQGHE